MHKNILVLYSLLILLLLNNCSEREPLNPIDPNNPITHGAPQNLRIYSNRNTATLSWDSVEVNTISKYYIYRSSQDSNQISKYDSVSANIIEYKDTGLVYDKTYFYAIQAVTETDTSLKSDVVAIIPGEFNFLIADLYGQNILELTFDARYVLNNYKNITPTGLAMLNRRVYFTDINNENIQIIDNDEIIKTTQINEEPVEIAANKKEKLLYIACRKTNNLITSNAEGDILNKTQLNCDIYLNSDIAYDEINNYIWITDQDSSLIYYHDLNQQTTTLLTSEIDQPDEIEIASDGGCWIASGEGIIRIKNDKTITSYLSNEYIYDISKDQVSGEIYYSGYREGTREIGYLSQDGSSSEILYQDEFYYITTIECIPGLRGTGLLLVNALSGQLTRLSPDGEIMSNALSLNSVEDIILK